MCSSSNNPTFYLLNFLYTSILLSTYNKKGLLCPTRCIIVLSGTPNSDNILICVCLKIWVVKCLPSKSHRRINSLVALFRIDCFLFTILTIESPRAFLSQRYSFWINRFYFLLYPCFVEHIPTLITFHNTWRSCSAAPFLHHNTGSATWMAGKCYPLP